MGENRSLTLTRSVGVAKVTCHACDRIKSNASIPQYLHPPRFNRRSRRREASDAVATVGENAGNTVTRVMKRENDSAYCEETRARIARRRRRDEIARTIWARTFAREDPHKKHITVIVIIRAHRGRDFAWVFAAIKELRALEVAPRSSNF